VNGTIAATGRTFSLEESEAEQFEAMVRESSFRPGRNILRVYEVVTQAGAPALRPL
jgi:hypothetical protein